MEARHKLNHKFVVPDAWVACSGCQRRSHPVVSMWDAIIVHNDLYPGIDWSSLSSLHSCNEQRDHVLAMSPDGQGRIITILPYNATAVISSTRTREGFVFVPFAREHRFRDPLTAPYLRIAIWSNVTQPNLWFVDRNPPRFR